MCTNRVSQNPKDAELHCVWMDAGLVALKLCDRELRCESCEFDQLIRQRQERIPESRVKKRASCSMPDKKNSRARDDPDAYLFAMIDQFLRPWYLTDLPADRKYFKNQTWIKQESDVCRLGVTHLVGQLLGDVAAVVLPSVPQRVEAGSPCNWIVHRYGTQIVRSPVRGTIVRANSAVSDHPPILLRSPFDQGWLVEIECPNRLDYDDRGMEDRAAISFFEHQAAELRQSLHTAATQNRPKIGATAADGGVELTNIREMLGPIRYYRIVDGLMRQE